LHPDVTSKMAGMADAKSDGDAYYMPAVGYARKTGKLTYGIGMMAQGGMGTEYGKTSFLSNYQAASDFLGGPVSRGASGMENRSELGIGRLMFPLAFDVSDAFTIGGSIDYLWGGLDLQMVMSGAMFAQFTGFGGASPSPLGSAGGSLVTAMSAAPPNGFGVTDVRWAQFDFSEGGNKMKQRLKTDGWAGNIGFTWKAAPNLTVGGVYHAKTSLGDMTGNGAMNMDVDSALGNGPMTIMGKLKVIDFQWPETYGVGIAYQANDRLLLAFDYKRIGWSDSMKNFKMQFVGEGNTGAMAGANGLIMDANLNQNWDDQDVFMIGAAYKFNPALTLRAGLNLANNPVPDNYMHPLFPATIKNTLTLGFGYQFSPASSFDFSLTHAPKVSATNNNMGVTTTHAQSNNWQAMYSHRF